jgi:hypothetical protein
MPNHPRHVTVKTTFHALVAISGWALFVFWWIRVFPQIHLGDGFIALVFIRGTVCISMITTLLWIRYNIGIFRRKGPRKNLTEVAENHCTDVLGRRIEPLGSGSFKTARHVIVSLEGESKKYEVAGEVKKYEAVKV